MAMRWVIWAGLGALLAGCATQRTVTVSARPVDSEIKIDGIGRGRGPITEPFIWKGDETHTVGASRLGYKDQTLILAKDDPRDAVRIDLKPQSRRITINIGPEPAIVAIDGKAVSGQPVSTYSVELPFTVDAQNKWIAHEVTAVRAGWQTAQQQVAWTDEQSTYALTLQPMRKTISVTTTPPGAKVYFDGKLLGASPVKAENRAFAVDPKTNLWRGHALKVVQPGYDPVEQTISWDDGKTDYHIDLTAKTKTATFKIDPAGATVSIDGQVLQPDKEGNPSATLQFPPVDEKGTLKTYTAVITKKTAASEWEPKQIVVGWENGKTEYSAHLKEILTRPAPLIHLEAVRGDEGWRMVAKKSVTLAMKDVTGGPGKQSPALLSRLPKGTIIDTLTVSPDGSKILFTVLKIDPQTGEPHSQMKMIQADGSSGEEIVSDGKTLDIQPSFTPDGKNIVFSSNRGGRRQKLWEMSASGAGPVSQLTVGETNDLWPTVDTNAKPRLFYEALVDTQAGPRLYLNPIDTARQTDLTYGGGMHPQISPKADAVVFVRVNTKTGKRNVYMMSDKGANPVLLTSAGDADEFSPVWSADGSKIAFVSDRAANSEGQHNDDIWVLDLSRPRQPMQVTFNESQDDCPAWDPNGKAIYFRSNRGGNWGIWKINLP